MKHDPVLPPPRWLVAVATLVLPPTLKAAEPFSHQESEEIVVTATRLPTPRSRVASSTTVITAEDIARRQLRTVPQALRTVPGLHVVQSGGPGQQTSVFMRGANSNQTLVLIDGVEANDPSNPNGAMDLSNLLVDNIERIEIVRGPQSGLYGSKAIGGVINIITRKGEGRPSVSARLEGGSYNTKNPQVGVSGAEGALGYSASLTYLNTDGHSVTPKHLRNGATKESDSNLNWTGSTRFDWTPNEILETSVIGRYIREDKTNTDPELESFGFGTTEDKDAFLRSDQFYLRGQGKIALFGGLWDATLGVSYTNYDRKSRNNRDDEFTETLDRSNFEGDKLKFELKNDLYLHDDHIVTVGVETEKENSDSNGFTDFGGFRIDQNTDADDRVIAYYLQDQFSLHERFFGTAGVRVDHSDDSGTEPTFRIAPVYLHKETGTRITGSIGTGFKVPSLNQRFGFSPNNFGTAFRGNPNLDAEKSLGWDLGFEQTLWGGRFNFGATYFWNRIKDFIELEYDAVGNSTAVNLDEIHSLGVETFTAAEPIPQLSLRVDYTYTKAEDDDGGAKLLRRPSHKVSGDIQYRFAPKAQVTGTVIVVDDWVDIHRLTSERVTPSSYTVVDLAASYEVRDWLTLIGRVDNLTDERYEPAHGFEAPGRGYFGGFELKL